MGTRGGDTRDMGNTGLTVNECKVHLKKVGTFCKMQSVFVNSA